MAKTASEIKDILGMNKKSPYPSSSVDNKFGMSNPTEFPELDEANSTPLTWIENIPVALDNLFGSSTPLPSETTTTPVGAAKTTTEGVNTLNELIAGRLDKAQAMQKMGYLMKGVGAATEMFDQIVNITSNIAGKQVTNAKLAADNEIQAIENQVLYTKNQLMDRFNQTVARNTLINAAKNLKVTTASILEQSKKTAEDITYDFRTLESNANLRKINLEASKRMADVSAKYMRTQQWIGFAKSVGSLVGSFAGMQGGYEALSQELFGNTSFQSSVYGGK